MINPISISTNPIYYTNRQAKETKPANVSAPNFELSDYKTGQAILARNNISFRNLATPIEVTDKYNKKIEDKDHLDLPNVHIYEYPDTNLQVFVNADENITTNDYSATDLPKIQVYVSNTEEKKFNLLKEKILFAIIENKLKDISMDMSFSNSDSSFSFNGFYDKKFLNNLPQINYTIFNLNISDKDLYNAKKHFQNYIEKPNIITALYGEDKFKSQNDMVKELESITLYDLKEYYEKFKQNLTMQIFVTVSKNYFDTNKDQILKKLNDNITQKLIKYSDIPASSDFVINETIKTISGDQEYTTLNYPVPLETVFDDILGDIVKLILNNNQAFNSDYKISEQYFSLPYNLKDNCPKKDDNKFICIEVLNDYNKNSLSIYKNNLGEILDTPLEKELNNIKDFYKEKLKETFTEEHLDIIKSYNLVKYCDAIYNLYEIIDDIKEDDVKKYIKTYFIKQNPIVQQGKSIRGIKDEY